MAWAVDEQHMTVMLRVAQSRGPSKDEAIGFNATLNLLVTQFPSYSLSTSSHGQQHRLSL